MNGAAHRREAMRLLRQTLDDVENTDQRLLVEEHGTHWLLGSLVHAVLAVADALHPEPVDEPDDAVVVPLRPAENNHTETETKETEA